MSTEEKTMAVVSVDGRQIKVEEGATVFLDRRREMAGAELKLNDVVMVAGGAEVKVGDPFVEGAYVTAKVEEPFVKDDKVIIFKRKRRKGYKVKKGHRQSYTRVLIEKIVAK